MFFQSTPKHAPNDGNQQISSLDACCKLLSKLRESIHNDDLRTLINRLTALLQNTSLATDRQQWLSDCERFFSKLPKYQETTAYKVFVNIFIYVHPLFFMAGSRSFLITDAEKAFEEQSHQHVKQISTNHVYSNSTSTNEELNIAQQLLINPQYFLDVGIKNFSPDLITSLVNEYLNFLATINSSDGDELLNKPKKFAVYISILKNLMRYADLQQRKTIITRLFELAVSTSAGCYGIQWAAIENIKAIVSYLPEHPDIDYAKHITSLFDKNIDSNVSGPLRKSSWELLQLYFQYETNFTALEPFIEQILPHIYKDELCKELLHDVLIKTTNEDVVFSIIETLLREELFTAQTLDILVQKKPDYKKLAASLFEYYNNNPDSSDYLTAIDNTKTTKYLHLLQLLLGESNARAIVIVFLEIWLQQTIHSPEILASLVLNQQFDIEFFRDTLKSFYPEHYANTTIKFFIKALAKFTDSRPDVTVVHFMTRLSHIGTLPNSYLLLIAIAKAETQAVVNGGYFQPKNLLDTLNNTLQQSNPSQEDKEIIEKALTVLEKQLVAYGDLDILDFFISTAIIGTNDNRFPQFTAMFNVVQQLKDQSRANSIINSYTTNALRLQTEDSQLVVVLPYVDDTNLIAFYNRICQIAKPTSYNPSTMAKLFSGIFQEIQQRNLFTLIDPKLFIDTTFEILARLIYDDINNAPQFCKLLVKIPLLVVTNGTQQNFVDQLSLTIGGTMMINFKKTSVAFPSYMQTFVDCYRALNHFENSDLFIMGQSRIRNFLTEQTKVFLARVCGNILNISPKEIIKLPCAFLLNIRFHLVNLLNHDDNASNMRRRTHSHLLQVVDIRLKRLQIFNSEISLTVNAASLFNLDHRTLAATRLSLAIPYKAKLHAGRRIVLELICRAAFFGTTDQDKVQTTKDTERFNATMSRVPVLRKTG